MPELPEVEVTRLSFAQRIAGAQVQAVRLGAPLRWPLGIEPEALHGLVVDHVGRRGKYLWLQLRLATPSLDVTQDPTHAGGLLMHLGMSGSLRFDAQLPLAGKHDHFDLITHQGTLRLHDPRRFGAVIWAPALDQGVAQKLLANLGLEPFDSALTPEWFYAQLQTRIAPIKQVLLAGQVVVGAGNIYACEALFTAGIHPNTSAKRISRRRAAKLLAAVQQTLARALALGGSSLRDFYDAHGNAGAFQLQAQVYGREALPCVRCNSPIKRIVLGQRSTYYCAKCQR